MPTRTKILTGVLLTAAAAGLSVGLTARGDHHLTPPSQSRPASGPRARGRDHRPAKRSTGQSHPRSTTLAESFRIATHQAAPRDLETVAVPCAHQTWAIDPIGMTSAQDPNPTLWFGEQTGAGPWHWTPSTLPGALSMQLPKPIDAALQWAWDLNQGQAGPDLGGPVQWSAITGHVGMPQGWTLQTLSAADSPLGRPTMTLTVWMPSFTGSFTGYYGVETAWDTTNAATGTHGLLGLDAAPGPLAHIVRHNTHS